MFIGAHYHSLDDKHRVAVPRAFRPELEHGSVMTYGLDGCLFIFTSDSWSILLDKLATLPLTNKAGRSFLRLLTYNAAPLDMDKVGRTLIPENLRLVAGIDKDVVFAGALTRVELWDKQKYHTYVESLEGQEGEIETALTELGI